MNTPNKITLSRLLLIPIIVFFYLADFIPYGRLVATIVFIIACLTDFLDGYLARKNNQVTDLGKFFDAIADKVLIMTGMILIIAGPINGSLTVVWPTWLGITCVVIMLAREFIISALRQVAASKGIVLAADKGGKIKAVVQYVSVSLYMIFAFILTDIIEITEVSDTALIVIRYILMLFLIAATLLTVYSGVSYLIRNKKVFKNTQNSLDENKQKPAENTTEGVQLENVSETADKDSKDLQE
mgnify:CR=1 FL=1